MFRWQRRLAAAVRHPQLGERKTFGRTACEDTSPPRNSTRFVRSRSDLSEDDHSSAIS